MPIFANYKNDKNDSIKSKNMPILKLPRFFSRRVINWWVKNGGKFKAGNFFDWIELFLYCLTSSWL